MRWWSIRDGPLDLGNTLAPKEDEVQDWGFNQWMFTTVMGIILAIVAFMYRDLRKELHELHKLMRSFSEFVIAANTNDKNWDEWRGTTERRLANHSDRISVVADIATVNREKITQLERWKDRLDIKERGD